MIRSSFALTPSLKFLSQILRAAPVHYFKKGRNMERVRESKKQIFTFCMYPFSNSNKAQFLSASCASRSLL